MCPARRSVRHSPWRPFSIPVAGSTSGILQVLEASRYIAALVLEIERLAVGPGWLGGGRGDALQALVGSSEAIRDLRDRITRVAATDFTVLVEGESGAGKELVARQLHELSRRRRGPFVAVNCAALVETLLEAELFGIEERTATGVRGRRGKFEHADGGTLFLDEVSDLSLSAQAKLLRVIQDLRSSAWAGPARGASTFASSLRRIAGWRSSSRRGAFAPISTIDSTASRFACPPCATGAAISRSWRSTSSIATARCGDCGSRRRRWTRCRTYEWPGNVRELERVIERAIALGSDDEIGLDDLPPHVAGEYVEILAPSAARGETLREWARRYVRLTLDRYDDNRKRAADALGISYHTLRTYLREMREAAAETMALQDCRTGPPGLLHERRDDAGESDGRRVAAQEEP